MVVGAGPGKGTTYNVLSSEKKAAHGIAPTLWVYDELAQADNRQLLDALQTSSGKRDRCLGIVISTQASNDRHWLSLLIDDGLKSEDPSIVVQLIAAPPDANPFDPEVIRAANPALGIYLKESDVFAAAKVAARSPAEEPGFRNLRLNQRVDASAEKKLLTPAQWALGNGPVDENSLAGKECIGGLDLSRKIDLTALVLAFEVDGIKHLVGRYWTPLDALDARSQAERELFQQWLKAGHLIGIDGPTIRLEFVAREIVRLSQRFRIRRIHYDRLYSADLRFMLKDIGSTVELTDCGQGYRDFAPCASNFLEAAVSGKIRHGGNPVLTAAVMGAAVVSNPAGDLKVDKAKSEGQAVCRIDPAVAAIMAVGAKREPAREFAMLFI
jgi:phage terminase large subunit-like protein